MKKILIVLGVLVVLVIGAVVAAPFLVPTETIKSQLAAQVERATGRSLTVDGDIDLSVLPTIAVDMSDVHFANASGSEVADMVSLKELKVALKVLPLLSGAVEVDEFVLVEPVIHLEVDADGRPNWELESPGGSAETVEEQTTGGGESGGGLPITELKLGDIRLENGTVIYVDRAAGTEERIEAVNMKVSLDDIQSPLQAAGTLDYKGKTIKVDLGLVSPYAVLQGGDSPLRLGVKSDLLNVGFDGDLNNQAGPSTAGAVDLAVPSIRDLAAWLAEPIAFEGEGLQALAIKGQLNGSAERVAFTEATVSLDQIEGKGEVTADLTGAVPKIGGRLDLGAVDLNPYLAPSTETAAEGAGAASPPASDGTAAGGAADWSDLPIELPPLGGVDLAFELTLDSLKVQELKLDRTVLALTMAGERLTAELKEFGLYQGKGNGRLEVAVAAGRPTIRQRFSLAGLQALPFLTDAADFERLEGTANADFDLTTSGGTERQLVQNLNGSGKVRFADGAITGINIAAMVRNVGSAFLDAAASEARKTDFAELSGSFAIKNGVLENDDLTLQAPTLRITGAGSVDLPARQVDYRIEPKAAATLEGQGGQTEVAGLLVPVVVTGGFDDLKFKPDLSDLVEQAIKDPKALKKQVKEQIGTLGDAPKDVKKQLKAIEKGGAKQLLEELSKEDGDGGSPAGNLLKGLFKQ